MGTCTSKLHICCNNFDFLNKNKNKNKNNEPSNDSKIFQNELASIIKVYPPLTIKIIPLEKILPDTVV